MEIKNLTEKQKNVLKNFEFKAQKIARYLSIKYFFISALTGGICGILNAVFFKSDLFLILMVVPTAIMVIIMLNAEANHKKSVLFSEIEKIFRDTEQ